MTIDEQLLPFRGRCPFRQYIPSKPARYGIKTFALVDARTFYTYNLETYLGKQPDPSFQLINCPEDVVLRLIEPIKGSGRNITADNWFSSLPLIRKLAKLQLSYLGTVKKCKRDIPPEFQPIKSREPLSTIFGFHQTTEKLNVTLMSYIPEKKKGKKKKAVIMMTTLFDDDAMFPGCPKNKPLMIHEYNKYKCGVDVVDQMCAGHSIQRTTNRWPLVVMSNLGNISAINGYVIYKENHPATKMSRFKYLQNLGRALIMPHITKRANIQQLPVNTKKRCHELTGQMSPEPSPSSSSFGPLTRNQPEKQTSCAICQSAKHKKNTRHVCAKCSKNVCSDHFYKICDDCIPK